MSVNKTFIFVSVFLNYALNFLKKKMFTVKNSENTAVFVVFEAKTIDHIINNSPFTPEP